VKERTATNRLYYGDNLGVRICSSDKFVNYLRSFNWLPRSLWGSDDSSVGQEDHIRVAGHEIPRFTKEYWTQGQRQAHSLHEVSYRACFKPQLPGFFIQRLTDIGDVVYDPFAGRGTTALEAALLGRRVVSNDINPLSKVLVQPRLLSPSEEDVRQRLSEIGFDTDADQRAGMDLTMFYHRQTLSEIVSLKEYLSIHNDPADSWIRMVATNRLTGHSKGFFSVYTMPPNQAVSAEAQRRINERRKQVPEYRNTRQIILKKTRRLLRDLKTEQRRRLEEAATTSAFYACDARKTEKIKSGSVALTVTSPPFLDVVQYAQDNWLRCWFNDLPVEKLAKRITMTRKLEEWTAVMQDVFRELYRITTPGGWVAFEVGEVRNGTLFLDEVVAPLGVVAGFDCVAVMVNEQNFTKTANCWGVGNNAKGTNTNRIVVFRKTGGI